MPWHTRLSVFSQGCSRLLWYCSLHYISLLAHNSRRQHVYLPCFVVRLLVVIRVAKERGSLVERRWGGVNNANATCGGVVSNYNVYCLTLREMSPHAGYGGELKRKHGHLLWCVSTRHSFPEHLCSGGPTSRLPQVVICGPLERKQTCVLLLSQEGVLLGCRRCVCIADCDVTVEK